MHHLDFYLVSPVFPPKETLSVEYFPFNNVSGDGVGGDRMGRSQLLTPDSELWWASTLKESESKATEIAPVYSGYTHSL